MLEERKPEVVSDKAEKKEAARLLHEETAEKFVRGNRGKSIKECPIDPVGSVIFLKYNLKDTGKLVLDQKDQQTEDVYFKVIGVGGNATTVEIGDRLFLKPTADVQTYITEEEENQPEYKFHMIFEHAILGIMKKK